MQLPRHPLHRFFTGLPLLLLLLAACTTAPETKLTRFALEDRATLELQLPRGWAADPSLSSGSRLALIRFSSRGPGTVQLLRIAPRPAVAAATAAGAETARRELAASKECEGVSPTVLERPLGKGVAAYCVRERQAASTASPLTPTTAGALVLPGLVLRFAMLGVSEEEQATAWAILQSVQVTRFPITY